MSSVSLKLPIHFRPFSLVRRLCFVYLFFCVLEVDSSVVDSSLSDSIFLGFVLQLIFLFGLVFVPL